MLPSSSIGNAPTTEPKAPVQLSLLEVFVLIFVFRISFTKKQQYLRMTLMQSKDNIIVNFLLYLRTIFSQGA